MRGALPLSVIFAAGLSTVAFAADIGPADAKHPQNACFFARQFESWKAPDDHTLYIRVTPRRYYRLDLAASCSGLKYPNSHLVTKFHGSASVCGALDWDLAVVESPGGIAQACIVKSMTQLSPDAIAEIPEKFRP